MRKLFREPLAHFVLLGALLFIGHGLWARYVAKSDYTITVDPAEIQRQSQIFATENGRPATDEDIEGLLFAYVEEQVLMREAQRLGLDEDDTIIKRRLAQKMRFMISDVGAPPLPKEVELQAYFEASKAQFIEPQKYSFRHIYFSPASRETIEADAKAALQIVDEDNWQTLGDPFILSRTYKTATQTQITRDFGRDFAASIPELKQGMWLGPIESALGLHIVHLDSVAREVTPTFEQARPAVEAAWADEASRAANEKRLEDLMRKYKVVVDE